ncbi:MAG: Uma2 family endonuclease [Planctomycetaceae bacterium]
MSTADLLADHDVEIPPSVVDLSTFREWALSKEFPERGRIDFVDGRIEVDMSPDNIFFHSAPKSELAVAIGNRLSQLDLGEWFVDKTRISCPDANLSVEPDIVLIRYESFDSGRVSLTPTTNRKPDSFIEIEGPPDLVVEVVSESSVAKDTRRLRQLYFAAGVAEYWLVDARGGELHFDILLPGESEYQSFPADTEGWRRSAVLMAEYQFTRRRNRHGHWQYRLNQRDELEGRTT